MRTESFKRALRAVRYWRIGGLGDWRIESPNHKSTNPPMAIDKLDNSQINIEITVWTKSCDCYVLGKGRMALLVPQCFCVELRRNPATSLPLALEQRLQPNLPEIAYRPKESHLRLGKLPVMLQFKCKSTHGTYEVCHLKYTGIDRQRLHYPHM